MFSFPKRDAWHIEFYREMTSDDLRRYIENSAMDCAELRAEPDISYGERQRMLDNSYAGELWAEAELRRRGEPYMTAPRPAPTNLERCTAAYNAAHRGNVRGYWRKERAKYLAILRGGWHGGAYRRAVQATTYLRAVEEFYAACGTPS